MHIRAETTADIDAIQRVTTAAFAGAAHSDGNEARIVNALRAAGALVRSLVAESDGQIVGHIALSSVTLSDDSANWLGLAPLSVAPDHQRQGIGSALVVAALAALPALNAAGCVVLGDPAYYTRFGFKQHTALTLPGFDGVHFMALATQGEIPAAVVAYHSAFQVA